MVKNGVKMFWYFGVFLVLGVIFGLTDDHFFLKHYKWPDASRVVTCLSENIKIYLIRAILGPKPNF